MAKRTATTELTHDNWDIDDDKVEEPGQCQLASPEALQGRVIRKAKRSRDASDEEAVKSPFRGFSGFGKSASPFTWNSPDSSVFGKRKNGCGVTENLKLSSESSSDVTSANKKKRPSEDSEIDSKNLEHFHHLQKLNESVLRWMQTHMALNPYCDFTPVFNDYKNHLAKLEHEFPIQKESIPSNSKSNSDGKSPFKVPGLVPARSTSFLADKSADSIAKSGFSKFMKSKNNVTEDDVDEEMSYGAGFTSNTTNTSTFSFGIKAPALTAMSTGSPMGPTTSHKSGVVETEDEEKNDDSETTKGKEEESKTAPLFKFGYKPNFSSLSSLDKSEGQKSEAEPFRFSSGVSDPKFFSFSAAQSTSSVSNTAKEEEEYVPPKNEVSAVVEEDAVYSIRCKLFFKKDDAYVDKGVGTLYLKSPDGKTQLLIRADTNLGNILLNIRLSSSIPVQRTGKNNVLIVCVPNPCLDPKKPDSKEAIPMLIRVKTSSEADELLEAMNKYKS